MNQHGSLLHVECSQEKLWIYLDPDQNKIFTEDD